MKTCDRCGKRHACKNRDSCNKCTGHLRKLFPREYRSWFSMQDRCLNKNNSDYRRYGGRGIGICNRWVNQFPNFIDDMGAKPSREYSLDRIDNDGDYGPENCRWATNEQQSRNTDRSHRAQDRIGNVVNGRMVLAIVRARNTCFYRVQCPDCRAIALISGSAFRRRCKHCWRRKERECGAK